jgi:acyl-CoA thioester hydrolase
MYTVTVSPRFGDINGLGHINIVASANWFDLGRMPICRLFDPSLTLTFDTWPLIIAHTDYEFLDPMSYQYDIEIRTYVRRVGTKSFTMYHEAWQEGRLCVTGNAVIVHYDFSNKVTTEIPEKFKEKLREHLLPENYFFEK